MTKKKESVSDLRKKIKYLEEEVVRKQEKIEDLEERNALLFKTAVKNSERKVKEKEF